MHYDSILSTTTKLLKCSLYAPKLYVRVYRLSVQKFQQNFIVHMMLQYYQLFLQVKNEVCMQA